MKTSKFFLALSASLCLLSCAHDSFKGDEDVFPDEMDRVPHGMIVLGERLEDPYSLDNMTKALASLYPTKAGTVELSATDHYVRLLPSCKEDLDALEKMGVKMLDHPLDYQIVEEGDYYHDPQIPDGECTWQYAVVPPDFVAPSSVRCELIHKCYLAEAENVTKAGLDWVDWDAVEMESYRLTGNTDLLNAQTKGEKVAHIPQGQIRIVDKDHSPDTVGVSGVQVSCNVFVKFDRCFTDKDGNYQMKKSFKSNPRYRLVYTSSKGFTLGFNAVFVKGSISTLGKHPSTGCSITVSEKSDNSMFKRCAINNAAYDYYESCSAYGVKIKTPPSNLTIWNIGLMESSATLMLHQGAILDIDMISGVIGEYLPIVKLFAPDIILGSKNYTTYSQIYHCVQHELAHASHYMQVGNTYWDAYALFILASFTSSGGVTYGTGAEDNAGYCEIGEMWAYYVENILYRQRYENWIYTYGTKYWFRPEILIYLDNRGMNRFKIFPALVADVHSRDNLRARLITLYPECKSMINEAFYRYL